MRLAASAVAALLLAGLPGSLPAQKEKREPLTAVEIDKIREAGIDPPERVKLYAGFVDDHVNTVKGLAARPHSPQRAKKLDSELQDLAALVDEFGSNLDVYDERKADIRKALEKLNEACPKWMETLNALPREPGFDLARTGAIESMKDLVEQAATMLTEQTKYFEEHKDERGQDRYEPK